MYINFWYPICIGTELEDQPMRVQVFGLQFAAFRDSQGHAHVVSDTCIHRGGSLSAGTVRDDCIVCPYHGWSYAGTGECKTIPSMKKGKTPARAKIDAYPVKEKYGLIFAFLGDLPENERPPLLDIPEIGQDGWRANRPTVRDINCYYERSVENGLDPYHNEFVHPSQGLPKIIEETITMHESDWGTGFSAAFGELKPKVGENELESDPNQLSAGSLYYGPNTLVTDIHFSAETAMIQYAFETPISETVTRVYLVNLRNIMLEEEQDENVIKINNRVADEDQTILEDLWPVRTPDTTTKELLTTSDEFVVRYRKHLQEWDKKGWRIDTHKLRSNKGDVAYAVPSPGRRERGNWILDPVPLVSA